MQQSRIIIWKCMALPDFLLLYRELIATPSISSLDPKLSQSNRAVIEHLASWCEELGFACEIKPLSTDADKFNLIAKRGHGSGGLMLAGHTDTVPFDQGRWSMDQRP